MRRIAPWLSVLAFVTVAGCRDGGLAPPATPRARGPAFDALGAPGCPGAAAAAATVSDEASLRAALAAAVPGEVIAVRGLISVTADLLITTDGLELTCATPGSGLVAAASGGAVDMVTVLAKSVTVDRFVLDGSAAGDSPYIAFNDGVNGFATDAHVTNNQITCTPGGVCVFIVGVPRTIVSGNHITVAGPFTGVHIQPAGVIPRLNPSDDSRVEGNTLIATSPSQPSPFGAIRVVTASRVSIANNVIQGPWANGIVLTDFADGHVAQNDIESPLAWGIRLSRGFVPFPNILVTNTAFVTNSVTGAPSGAVFPFKACNNTFLTNVLEGNGGDIGIFFPTRSGGNVVVGVDNATVIDNGAMDCDNDGDIDPNVIKGKAPSHQADPAADPSDPVRLVHGVKVQ